MLALSQENVLDIKRENNIKKLYDKTKLLVGCLLIKFALFFILSFLILVVYWYYIACFCCIYKNTQIHLIKDSVISFGSSMIYPLLICLLPGIFRIVSLRSVSQNQKMVYKVSQLLEML